MFTKKSVKGVSKKVNVLLIMFSLLRPHPFFPCSWKATTAVVDVLVHQPFVCFLGVVVVVFYRLQYESL